MGGTLNVIGPHNLRRSGTIRGCSFVGVSMALLEVVCHCWADFEGSYAQDTAQWSQLTSCCLQYIELPVTIPASCLPASYHDNGLTSETVSKPTELNVPLISAVCHGHDGFSQQ